MSGPSFIMELSRVSESKNQSPRMRPSRAAACPRGLLCLLLALVALSLCARAGAAAAVSPAQVSSADDAIQSAFASVYAAERSGGNVTPLDSQLNQAIQLVQEAEAVNATDPSRAASDIQNATSIAQAVAAESASVARSGSSSRQATEATSLGAAAAIVVVAAMTYIFGGRVYRRAWLRAYRDYVVRPADG